MRRLGLFMLLLAGCGSGDGAEEDQFLGSWSEILTITGVCTDGSNVNESSTGSMLVTKGTVSDIVRAGTGGSMTCPIPLNIAGKRATLAGGATCTDTDGNSVSTSAWTLNVNGRSGSETGSAVIGLAGAGSCTVNINTTLTH